MTVALVLALAAVGLGAAAGAGTRADGGAPRPVVAVPVLHLSLAKDVRALRQDDWLRWPLAGAVTGRFGEQRAGHRHQGIDIPTPVGTPIRAAGAGTVVMREWQDGYGNYTCIRQLKFLTCYGHQSRFHTRLGEKVRQGEVIGYTGDTGTSEAPHLHFEVRLGRRPWGKPVNPTRYLPPEPSRFR